MIVEISFDDTDAGEGVAEVNVGVLLQPVKAASAAAKKIINRDNLLPIVHLYRLCLVLNYQNNNFNLGETSSSTWGISIAPG